MKLPRKDVLVNHRENGLSYQEIAEKYGASYDGIRQALKRDPNPKEARISGMPPPHITRHLLWRGYSSAEIKEMFTYKRSENGQLKSYLRDTTRNFR